MHLQALFALLSDTIFIYLQDVPIYQPIQICWPFMAVLAGNDRFWPAFELISWQVNMLTRRTHLLNNPIKSW